jgi:CAAX protease family protein
VNARRMQVPLWITRTASRLATLPPRSGSQSSLAPFVTYVVAFHLVWAAWPLVVYPRLVAIGDRTLTYALVNIGLRLLVWVAPVVLYLRRVDRVEVLDYLRLKGSFRRGLAVAAVLTALNFLGTVMRFGPPVPSLRRVTWNSVLGTSFMVGVIEEVPYRGFMLQKMAERVGFWRANLITSTLFLVVHLPGWIALGLLSVDRAVTVFVFAFVMACAFRLADSLWAPILTHSTNDLISFVLFGR